MKKSLISISVLALTAVYSSQAQAIYYDYGDSAQHYQGTQQAISSAESNINGTINTMSNNVVQALKLSTGQTSGNIKESVAASARIADAQDDQENKRRIEDARMQAINESKPTMSRCISTTSSITSASLSNNTDAVRGAISDNMVGYQLGDTTLTAPEASEKQAAAHCSKFSTSADVKIGLCSSATATDELANADVDASRSLFASNTMSPDTEDASNLLLTKIVGSDPYPPLTAGEAATPKGRAEIANRNEVVAKRSVATEALSYIRSAKTGVDSPELVDWANARAAATGRQRDPNAHGVSEDEHLELQSRSWFYDQDWMKGVQDKNMDQKMADIADMQAFQVVQNQKLYEVLERLLAVEATSLSIRVDQEKARLQTASN